MDSFLVAPKQYLLDFFNAYREKVGLPFFAQLHPEQVLSNPEILTAGDRCRNEPHGCRHPIRQVNAVNREIFNRRTSHEKLLEFARLMVGQGDLRVDYHIVTHNPFDTPEDFEETVSLIGRLPKTNASLFPVQALCFC